MGRLKIFIIMLLFLFAACSKSEQINIPEEFSGYENLAIFSADSEPVFEITLNRQTIFGDTEDVLLGSWLSAVVDNRDRVFLADYQQTALHLYNPDGTHNRQIGQEGDGPLYVPIYIFCSQRQYVFASNGHGIYTGTRRERD